MKTRLMAAAALMIIFSCNNAGKTPTPGQVAAGIMERQADVVQSAMAEEWEMERMRRIALDFNKTEEEALAYIRQFFPDVTSEQMKKWEASKTLESMNINGEKRYFSRAFRNLFRIDSTCREKFLEINGPEEDPKAPLLQEHLPRVVA